MPSAVPKRKRPPTFSHYVDVDVDIDPEDLEEAGWVYVGNDAGETALPNERVIDTVERWHYRAHEGPWRWCQHELCDVLRGRSSHA